MEEVLFQDRRGNMLYLAKYIGIATLIVCGLLIGISACVDPTGVSQSDTTPAALLQKECADTETAMRDGKYRDVRRSLSKAREIASMHGLTIPESTASLGVPSAVLRLIEIESEMRVAYHEYNLSEVALLANEAIQLAKEDRVEIPERIVQMTRKMARGYLEPFYQGKPQFVPKPMDTVFISP